MALNFEKPINSQNKKEETKFLKGKIGKTARVVAAVAALSAVDGDISKINHEPENLKSKNIQKLTQEEINSVKKEKYNIKYNKKGEPVVNIDIVKEAKDADVDENFEELIGDPFELDDKNPWKPVSSEELKKLPLAYFDHEYNKYIHFLKEKGWQVQGGSGENEKPNKVIEKFDPETGDIIARVTIDENGLIENESIANDEALMNEINEIEAVSSNFINLLQEKQRRADEFSMDSRPDASSTIYSDIETVYAERQALLNYSNDLFNALRNGIREEEDAYTEEELNEEAISVGEEVKQLDKLVTDIKEAMETGKDPAEVQAERERIEEEHRIYEAEHKDIKRIFNHPGSKNRGT